MTKTVLLGQIEAFEAAVAEAASKSARRELAEQLNQTSRRLQQAETREIWIHTLVDAASNFCETPVLFAVSGNKLKWEGASGVDGNAQTEIAVESAPAFHNAIESADTVVAIGTERELSEPLARVLGASDRRVYLFPLVLRQKVVAILYAEPGEEPVDVSALELLTALAVASMEQEVKTVNRPPADLIAIAATAQTSPSGKPASWAMLTKPEQELHLRAQRFARTQVAQMVLHDSRQVKSGRAGRNVYATLKHEIDAGRRTFREQFMSASPSMVDYYHLELVRTLANDEGALLGADYPGPMV